MNKCVVKVSAKNYTLFYAIFCLRFFSLSRCCCCIALLLLKKRCIAKPTFYNISEFYESVNICKTLVKCAKLNICKIWIFNEAWNLKSTIFQWEMSFSSIFDGHSSRRNWLCFRKTSIQSKCMPNSVLQKMKHWESYHFGVL